MTKHSRKVIANNKKAFHDYTIEERFEAGIVLTGADGRFLARYYGIAGERRGVSHVTKHRGGGT